MSDFTIKKATTKPWLVATLKATNEETGVLEAVDLTEAEKVYARIKGPKTIKAAMEVLAAKEGKVRHKWTTEETGTVGTYEVEFLIVWKSGDTTVIPESGTYELVIKEGLE